MKIAVMGYGTIGSGVVEVLEINKEKIAKRAGEPIEVKYVLDLREFPGTPIENKIVHDYKVIAEDPEIGIVVETKYANRRRYARFLAEEAMQRWENWMREKRIEAIVPVPMYSKKERYRGYNQAALFGRALSEKWIFRVFRV